MKGQRGWIVVTTFGLLPACAMSWQMHCKGFDINSDMLPVEADTTNEAMIVPREAKLTNVIRKSQMNAFGRSPIKWRPRRWGELGCARTFPAEK